MIQKQQQFHIKTNELIEFFQNINFKNDHFCTYFVVVFLCTNTPAVINMFITNVKIYRCKLCCFNFLHIIIDDTPKSIANYQY